MSRDTGTGRRHAPRGDVLTLLIHLGYLAYDQERETARIPNEEIRREFQKSIREVDRTETIARVAASVQLVENTVHGDEAAVAEEIERVHAEWPSLYYNTEQALRSTIKLAYFCYADHYLRICEWASLYNQPMGSLHNGNIRK
ncbi:MAG: hypothetical protein IKG21_05750 [Atopobiaceae bacterium]|nr:hypothetical protein [Atopobiaceae bacterium]